MDIVGIDAVHSRKDLIRMLHENPSKECEQLVNRLKKQPSLSRGCDLKDIFRFLVNIDLPGEEALLHWENILEHKRDMSESLMRDVGLRVAIFDYFLNITKLIKNPKVIEQDVFVSVLESAFKDPLTGLFNRRYLDIYLEKQIQEAHKHNTNLSLLFFDVDNFKKYNDTFGHQEGDNALKKIGSVLRMNVRGKDMIMRYAGEEFVMVMRETQKSAAIELGKRLKDKIERFCRSHLMLFSNQTGLTVSGGVATFPEDGIVAKELIKRSDMALYVAKRGGKNQIRQYLVEKRESTRRNLEVPILYSYSQGGETIEMFGIVKNICSHGVLFESTREPPFGRDVELNIDSFEKKSLVSAIGRVVRKSRVMSKDKVEVAIAFTKIKKRAKS
ncbi:diguanylate cyclase [PVC group bacterium]|nr:diguanylate cyclase [PVC group bacterium]